MLSLVCASACACVRVCAGVRVCVCACVSSDDELDEWCYTFTYRYIYVHIAACFNSYIDMYQDNTRVWSEGWRATALVAVSGAGRILQSKVTNDYLGIGLAR